MPAIVCDDVRADIQRKLQTTYLLAVSVELVRGNVAKVGPCRRRIVAAS